MLFRSYNELLLPRPSGSSALKILSISSQHLLHDELLHVILFVCDVGEPILGSLFWSVIITDRSHLFMGFFGISLVVMAGSGVGLPLPLLAWSLLLLGTIASDMPFLVTIEANYFPYVVLRPLWIRSGLPPPITSWHEIFSFC